MIRGIPPEYSVMRWIAASVKRPRSRAPAIRSRLRTYWRVSSGVSGGIWHRRPMRCLSCRSSGRSSFARSSGWPTSKICRSLVVGVSKLERRRTCSIVSEVRFCASSMMRTVFWRARSRSIRKSLNAMMRRARDSSRLTTPRSARTYSSMSSNGRVELKMNETAVWPSSRWRRAWSKVVLPVPTFPVSRMKPLRSWVP